MKIDEKTRIVIAETIRREKEKNADMLYDLAVYGRLIEDDEPLDAPTSVEIDFNKGNITEKRYDINTKATTTTTINGCPKINCRHCKSGHCIDELIIKGKAECNSGNNYRYYEED